ncbi:MAG TPA: hypothetical protein VMX17_09475 [Candidatus Glassbacteria bacterium]|nr:hypothetical protein [Candidatus Glassbacteria bacterium]
MIKKIKNMPQLLIIVVGVLVVMGIILALDSCTSINEHFGLQNDNIIEELIEMEIENLTGIEIDLTP